VLCISMLGLSPSIVLCTWHRFYQVCFNIWFNNQDRHALIGMAVFLCPDLIRVVSRFKRLNKLMQGYYIVCGALCQNPGKGMS
jgi:hypothetical protein